MRTIEEILLDVGSATEQSNMDSLRQCMDELRLMHSELALVTANEVEGWVLLSCGQYREAEILFEKAISVHALNAYAAGVTRVAMKLGILYQRTGDYPKALALLHRAYDSAGSTSDASQLGSILSNIGIVYSSISEYDKALDAYTKSLEHYQEGTPCSDLGHIYGNIGNVYSMQKDYASALPFYRKAHNIAITVGNQASALHIQVLMFNLYIEMNDIEQADKALSELSNVDLTNPFTSLARDIGKAKLCTQKNEYEAARGLLLTAAHTARKHHIKAGLQEIHRLLRNIAEVMMDFRAYVEHNNEYLRITEEISGRNTAQRVAVQESERQIAEERKNHEKHLAILHSALPKNIADRVARGETVNDQHDNVAVMFLDLDGFTNMSANMDPSEVLALLEDVFGTCDSVVNTHGLLKIKTIGDSYMAVAFDAPQRAASAALELLTRIARVPVRIGLHCGPVVAGILGKERMQYDVWGDTVNVASRMESTGVAGRIQISEAMAGAIRTGSFTIEERGTVTIKGKGEMKTFWLLPAG